MGGALPSPPRASIASTFAGRRSRLWLLSRLLLRFLFRSGSSRLLLFSRLLPRPRSRLLPRLRSRLFSRLSRLSLPFLSRDLERLRLSLSRLLARWPRRFRSGSGRFCSNSHGLPYFLMYDALAGAASAHTLAMCPILSNLVHLFRCPRGPTAWHADHR